MSFERIEPGTAEWEAFYANHIHRYRFAADVLRDFRARNVLDAACGVGYGTEHLARSLNAKVIGVDRDGRAIEIARREFVHERAHFIAEDCVHLEEASEHGPYDAVVSFETVEHLNEPDAFLRAAYGTLRPEGLIVASVPNGDVATSADWDYHEHDFNAAEFVQILKEAGFSNVRLYGQRLNALGRLREQMRAEIHRLRFNPLVRLGNWVQTHIRKHAPLPPALPERVEDFDLTPAEADEIQAQGKDGPFVIVAVAEKSPA